MGGGRECGGGGGGAENNAKSEARLPEGNRRGKAVAVGSPWGWAGSLALKSTRSAAPRQPILRGRNMTATRALGVEKTNTQRCLYKGGERGWAGGGGGIFGWGKFRGPQILVPCVTVAGTTGLGIHSGCTKRFLGHALGAQNHSLGYAGCARKIFFGVCTSITYDPGMQCKGTSASLQTKTVSCRPREQDMARIVPVVREFLEAPKKIFGLD